MQITERVRQRLWASRYTTIGKNMGGRTMVRCHFVERWLLHYVLSLTDRVTAYKDGKYIFPNDEVSSLFAQRWILIADGHSSGKQTGWTCNITYSD